MVLSKKVELSPPKWNYRAVSLSIDIECWISMNKRDDSLLLLFSVVDLYRIFLSYCVVEDDLVLLCFFSFFIVIFSSWNFCFHNLLTLSLFFWHWVAAWAEVLFLSFTDEVLNNEAKKKWNKSVPIWKKMDMEMRHLQNL